jgi:type II secretory pathway pseudopilin PulG
MIFREIKNKKRFRGLRSTKGGFFIAELVVAIFIFAIVMTVSVGALITGLDTNKKTQSLKSVLNNLNVVLDTMSKTLAVGRYYRCDDFAGIPEAENPLTQDCANGGDQITFLFNEDYNGNGEIDDVINYRFVMDPENNNGYIARTMYSSSGGETSEIRMTAPEVKITDAQFIVTGSGTQIQTGNSNQPRVLIVVKGYAEAGNRATPTEFNLQTVVSQLVPDFE